MIPYIGLLGIPAIYVIVSCNNRLDLKKNNQITTDLFFSIWLLILFLRNKSVGVDLPVYEYNFKLYSQFTFSKMCRSIFENDLEVGYLVLSKLISMFTDNFQVIVIVCACIAVIPLWILYRNNARHAFLMILLFINIAPFPMYFSGLRQSMAMAFAVPCYYFCKEKKLIKFLVSIFIGYLIHKSAVILLLMYPVYHIKFRSKLYAGVCGIILIIVSGFKESIFKISFIFLDESYDDYIEGIHNTGAYGIFGLLLIILLYIYIVMDMNKIDADTRGLINIATLSLFLQSFASIHTIAMRMNYYYLIFIPILLVRIIDNSNARYRKIIELSIFLMIAFFIAYYYNKAFTGADTLGIYPYKSFLSDI